MNPNSNSNQAVNLYPNTFKTFVEITSEEAVRGFTKIVYNRITRRYKTVTVPGGIKNNDVFRFGHDWHYIVFKVKDPPPSPVHAADEPRRV